MRCINLADLRAAIDDEELDYSPADLEGEDCDEFEDD